MDHSNGTLSMATAADTAPEFPWQPEGCYRTLEPPHQGYNPVVYDGRLLSPSLSDAAADVTTGSEATGRGAAFSTFLPTQQTDTSLPPPQVTSADIGTFTNKSALLTPLHCLEILSPF